jgi:hypothetical protein
MSKIATPWGSAALVERLSVPQRVGDRRFATVVELLEVEGGARLVRLAYSTDGIVRRGPVTMRPRDLARLRVAVRKVPELANALGWDGEA